MNYPQLISPFADLMYDYLDLKLDLEHKLDSFISCLREIDNFFIGLEKADISFTHDDYEKFLILKPHEKHATHYKRINFMRNFMKYVALLGLDVFVPPGIKWKGTDFIPHIYTEDECKRYFLAADTAFLNYEDPAPRITIPPLFRLFESSGLRLVETLSIKVEDVDLEIFPGTITLYNTKNSRPRQVVMSPSMHKIMERYFELQARLYHLHSPLFQMRGKTLNPHTVYEWHREILRVADIPFIGNHNGPRIHDWRHHFALYSFVQMVKNGIAGHTALSWLSEYMGHLDVHSTERYIRLAVQIFPFVRESFDDKLGEVFNRFIKPLTPDEI